MSELLLVAILGCAGLISGLTGFAFALVASGSLLWIRSPVEASALVLACSILSQVIALGRLRVAPPWPTVLSMVAPGLLGAPLGVFLLQDLNANAVRLLIGLFLMSYAAFVAAVRPSFRIAHARAWMDALVGFGGGVLGGIAGLSGALPTAWCLLRGWDVRVQRAVYQSFTLVMQVWALVLLRSYGAVPERVYRDLEVGVPVVVAGVLAGLALFSRIDQATFRILVLAVLATLGVATTGAALHAMLGPSVAG